MRKEKYIKLLFSILLTLILVMLSLFLVTELEEVNTNSNSFLYLKQNTIELDYLNYIHNQQNDFSTTSFVNIYIDRQHSFIQTYYFINIMMLLNGNIEVDYFDDLKNLIDNNYYYSEIIYFIVKNSNAYSNSELDEIEKYYVKKLNEDNKLNDFNFYAILTLNEIDTVKYSDIYKDLKLSIDNRLKEITIGDSIKDESLIYFYLYAILNENNEPDNFNEVKTIYTNLREINNFYIDNKYYYAYLNNFFNLKYNAKKNDYDYFDLISSDLYNSYLDIVYLSYGNALSKQEKKYIYEHLYNLYEDGFYYHFYEDNQSLSYYYLYALNSIYSKSNNLYRYDNLYEFINSENVNLTDLPSVNLYLLSIVQNIENGIVNDNLKMEIKNRLNKGDYKFHNMYFLYLAAYNSSLENDFQVVGLTDLQNNLDVAIENEDLYLALQYLDLISLYYPEEKKIERYYNQIMKKTNENNSNLSYFVTLKSIANRQGYNYSIENIHYNKNIVNNFLIIKDGNRINKIEFYYDFYILEFIELNKDSKTNFHLIR